MGTILLVGLLPGMGPIQCPVPRQFLATLREKTILANCVYLTYDGLTYSVKHIRQRFVH